MSSFLGQLVQLKFHANVLNPKANAAYSWKKGRIEAVAAQAGSKSFIVFDDPFLKSELLLSQQKYIKSIDSEENRIFYLENEITDIEEYTAKVKRLCKILKLCSKNEKKYEKASRSLKKLSTFKLNDYIKTFLTAELADLNDLQHHSEVQIADAAKDLLAQWNTPFSYVNTNPCAPNYNKNSTLILLPDKFFDDGVMQNTKQFLLTSYHYSTCNCLEYDENIEINLTLQDGNFFRNPFDDKCAFGAWLDVNDLAARHLLIFEAYQEVSSYCICRRNSLENSFFVECQICKECYHIDCLGMTMDERGQIERNDLNGDMLYTCPFCQVIEYSTSDYRVNSPAVNDSRIQHRKIVLSNLLENKFMLQVFKPYQAPPCWMLSINHLRGYIGQHRLLSDNILKYHTAASTYPRLSDCSNNAMVQLLNTVELGRLATSHVDEVMFETFKQMINVRMTQQLFQASAAAATAASPKRKSVSAKSTPNKTTSKQRRSTSSKRSASASLTCARVRPLSEELDAKPKKKQKSMRVRGDDDQVDGNSQGTSTAAAGSEHKQPAAKNLKNDRAQRLTSRRVAATLHDDNQLTMARQKKLRFGRSKIHAWGVFAEEPLYPGDLVLEYKGELIRPIVADKRERIYMSKGWPDYMFRIDDEFICDATEKGSLARFLNHSCDPNCYTQIINYQGMKKIIIYAKTNIEVGQELYYDYKFPIEEDKIICNCGAAKCRGTMN